jgi:hypothetical protein
MKPFLYKESRLFKRDRMSYLNNKVKSLFETLDALPQIEPTGWGHYNMNNYNETLIVFIHCYSNVNNDGLFFFTRCLDRRYLVAEVDIKLSVSDLKYTNGDLPLVYEIHIKNQNNLTIGEIIDLIIENFNHHINHENFIKGYDLDLNSFSIKTLNDIRDDKIKEILNVG